MKNNFIKSFLNDLLEKKKLEKHNKINNKETNIKNNEKISNKEVINFYNWFENDSIKKEDNIIDNKLSKEISKNIKSEKKEDINDIKKEKNIKIDLEEKTDNIKTIENDIWKEMFGYLNTNSNLDNSLLKMDIEKDLNSWVDFKNKSVKDISNKNTDIKIVKNNKKVNLWWILFEFIIWILLIIYSLSYVKGNEAESKFLFSSVQLWKNTAINLAWKVWFLSKNVESDYIKKRETEIKKMMDLENKIQNCIHNEKNNDKKKELKNILYKISSFKYELMDTKSISLDDFIKKYDQFSLYWYWLKQTTDNLCK